MSKLDNVGLTTSDFRYTCTSLGALVVLLLPNIDHLKQVEDYVVFVIQAVKLLQMYVCLR